MGKARAKSYKKRSGAKQGRARVGARALEVPALPPAEELETLPAYSDLVPTAAQVAELSCARERIAARMGEAYAEATELGCIVRLDRGFPLVALERGFVRAEHSIEFAKGASAEAGLMPTVGDWVAVAVPEDHDMGVIEEVLARKSAFVRWRGGARGEFQTLAANLDTVIIVAALGEDKLSLERIARSLVVVRDCGAQAAVVLTKADRKASSEHVEHDLARTKRLVGKDCPVVVTSSAESAGMNEVLSLVPPGCVAMILGESGAGKSTLLNALLGAEALATSAVRERDDMGRHTTVARMMVRLPNGGIICDAPGLRSLPLVGHERGLALAFPEIAERAEVCHFSDCTHGSEPGCAVRDAEAEGKLDSVRVEAYVALANEMRKSARTLDPDITL